MKPKERVLALIKISSIPLGGYQISHICGFWWWQSVYVYLKELEDAGLIEGRFVDGPYPRKRYYYVKP